MQSKIVLVQLALQVQSCFSRSNYVIISNKILLIQKGQGPPAVGSETDPRKPKHL